jgi:Cu+-exporting ATPase
VSAWFVPAVIASAGITFVAWAVAGPEPRLAHALVAAVAVVVVACPCALGLATPMSILVGVGRAATMGVLFKDAQALESLRAIDTLVVDKTGTLTEGKPRVVTVQPAAGWSAGDVVALAASVEKGSEHPLASAVLARAHEDGVALDEARDVQSATGLGITGRVGARVVAVGSAEYARSRLRPAGDAAAFAGAEALRKEGQTVLFVVVDGALAGTLGVADPVRGSARAAVSALRDEGVRLVVLTGDARTSAEAVARALGIDEVEAGLLPAAKGAIVRRLRAEGRRVAMAGDGVNDAPALAEAEVGIAMGTGTDVAMQTAGVVLVRGDLGGIVRARALSRAVMRNVRQNLWLAFLYNVLGVPLAAGALYPVLGWLLSPMFASAAMSLSSAAVIGNALRLRHAGASAGAGAGAGEDAS